MSRLLHWSPSRLYDRADSLSLEVGDGQVNKVIYGSKVRFIVRQ